MAPDVRLALGSHMMYVGSQVDKAIAGGGTLSDMHDTPAGRLAYNDRQPRVNEVLSGGTPPPSGRLAIKGCGKYESESTGTPSVRLAVAIEGGGAQSPKAFDRHLAQREDRPALLVSYVYLKPFLANRARYHYRDWSMDSGAYSAHNSGTTIDLRAYGDCCLRLLAEDPTLVEVFSLDVIGDWRASLRNTEALWARGIPAIPTFHPGEPWSALVGMAKDYPKIALGGVVGWDQRRKIAHVGQCFARTWPKPIHGLGMCSEKMLLAFPFHSVDATNWEIGPCKFGRWMSYGDMSVRGSKQNLRAEVEWYLKLESRARQRWRKEMAKLEATASPSPSGRLAMANTQDKAYTTDKYPTALGPVVRLAAQQHCDAQIARSGLGSPAPAVRLAYAETGGEGGERIDRALGPVNRRGDA